MISDKEKTELAESQHSADDWTGRTEKRNEELN